MSNKILNKVDEAILLAKVLTSVAPFLLQAVKDGFNVITKGEAKKQSLIMAMETALDLSGGFVSDDLKNKIINGIDNMIERIVGMRETLGLNDPKDEYRIDTTPKEKPQPKETEQSDEAKARNGFVSPVVLTFLLICSLFFVSCSTLSNVAENISQPRGVVTEKVDYKGALDGDYKSSDDLLMVWQDAKACTGIDKEPPAITVYDNGDTIFCNKKEALYCVTSGRVELPEWTTLSLIYSSFIDYMVTNSDPEKELATESAYKTECITDKKIESMIDRVNQ